MSPELLGKNVDNQVRAMGVLKAHGSMDYDELQQRLSLDHDEMQEVMRGMKFNGLVRQTTDESGARVYIADW